jgi:nuclear migration protein JNM1
MQATSARSPSVDSDDARNLNDDEESGVVRSKVDKDRAFSRFQDSKVNARKADFSDRLNGTRQYYKTSNRRRRKGSYVNGDDGEYDDLSSGEEESLDWKLARLRKEIEEARIELAEKDEDRELFSDAQEDKLDDDGEEHTLESINKLSEALDAVYTTRNGASRGPAVDLAQALTKFDGSPTDTPGNQAQVATYPTYTASSPEHQAQLSQALAKAAEFDTRLTFLEQALGLAGDSTFDQDGNDAPKPILHTLTTLDRQIQTLTNSTASVDAASGKTRKLIEQAEQLLKIKAEYSALDHPTTEDTENVSKLNALYGTLGTIDSLAPTLPLVLDRLRTLRLLHTSAAGAGSTLDAIEKRQAEQAAEIKQWSEAVEQVERNVKSSEGGLLDNVKSVEGWVKDLENRMARLS